MKFGTAIKSADELDAAVFDAYRWHYDISDEEILERLVTLNGERTEEERNGLIRWLRPEYQAPDEVRMQQVIVVSLIHKKWQLLQQHKKPYPRNQKTN